MSYNKETGMYEGFIYIILNDINPEQVYIGQTTNTPENRWHGHCGQIKNHTYTDKLHNKMEKYGKEHFVMEVLEHHKLSTKEELLERLDEREIALISKFDSYYNGLNSTLGGRRTTIHKMRPVQRFDLDGNYIAEYNGVEILKTEFDSVSSIYDCCNHNNSKYAYGSLWKYKDDDSPIPVLTDTEKREATIRYKALLQIDEYDYKGNLLFVYDNIEQLLSLKHKIKRIQIIECCSGRIIYVGTNIYRFHGERFDLYKTYRDKPKLVEQYDLEGNFIRVFESSREATRAMGLKGTQVSAVCRGKRKTAGGYMWKYVEDNSDFPNLEKEWHCIRVYQYKKDSLILDKIFESIKEAALCNNVIPRTISDIAKGKTRPIYYNYIWSFEELSKDQLAKMVNHKSNKPVVCLDADWNYISEYTSIKNAANSLFPDKKNAKVNIGNAIRYNRIAYGYRWILKENYEEVKNA